MNNFNKALQLILIFEGGFVNNPKDRGSITNFGVTQNTYNDYLKSKNIKVGYVKDIIKEEVEDIYYNRYWIKSNCDKMIDKLSIAVFDTSVNCGISRSIKILQKCLNIKDDGIFGRETLHALSNISSDEFVMSYIMERNRFYNNIVKNNPSQEIFLKGWLRRLQYLKLYIFNEMNVDQIKKVW